MSNEKKKISNLRKQVHTLILDNEKLESKLFDKGMERDTHYTDSITFQRLSFILAVLLIAASIYGVIESKENKTLTEDKITLTEQLELCTNQNN